MGLCIIPGMAFEVVYLIWKACCFKVMAACPEHIIGELELGMDVIPLRLKVAALVVDPMIAFNLYKRVPALLVCHCFVKGVKGGTRTCKEIVEPGGA